MSVVNPKDGHFSMGQNTLSVPMKLFQENRKRIVERLQASGNVPAGSVILLQGGGEQGVCKGDSSDSGPVFRQESYFHWCFGVLEPDFFGAIDLTTGNSILYQPRLDEDYAIFMGHVPSLAEVRERYRVNEVFFLDEMPDHLRSLGGALVPTLLLLEGPNTDSGKDTRPATFEGMSEFAIDRLILHPQIADCRVIKTSYELDVLRYASKISCLAHMEVMRTVQPGMAEYQAEATFLHHVYFYGGARHVCYTCIAASGPNGAIQHYGHAGAPNNRNIKEGDMCLFDFGAEYYCYTSDITCSFPVGGQFTAKQATVYNAVLRANQAVFAACKPGVMWSDMHLLANRVVLEDLTAAGVLRGSVEEMMDACLMGRVFQPLGMGHLLGLDIHDVGGYLEGQPERSQLPGLRYLRTARALQAGMVLTIEPGCYFIDYLLDRALADPELSKFLVEDKINEYRGSGGVRIEDVVAITETGTELFSRVPRTVEEIESWMAGDDSFMDYWK
eukprot:GFUD01012072.1.p1 GENE.GFUD01012072.1~~GFUD01012072.1.p1  ORF type:complete len:516 (+),score=101.89 GFUD01012072.1:47-1549(+)